MTAPSSPMPTWNHKEPSPSGSVAAVARLPSFDGPWAESDVVFVWGVYVSCLWFVFEGLGDSFSGSLIEASRLLIRALASRSRDSAEVGAGQTHSSPDRRHPVQMGRCPLHLTLRDLQLEQANPYRRDFRVAEDVGPEVEGLGISAGLAAGSEFEVGVGIRKMTAGRLPSAMRIVKITKSFDSC